MAFCPQCKSEYRQGFTECADCKAKLVERLPDADEQPFEETPSEINTSSLKFVSVFVSDNPQETALVRNILADNNIPFITRGEDKTGFKYVDFLVREDKAFEAMDLLKDAVKESTGIDTSVPLTEDFPDNARKSIDQPGVGPRKEPFNFSIVVLMAVIVLLFALPLAKTARYIIAGGLMVILIITVVYSRDKRI
jgi:hypothetical protein